MQELYLDKSGGCISAAQFNELNREFLDQVEQLEKQRNTLDQKLGERGGWEEQKRSWNNVWRMWLRYPGGIGSWSACW